MAFRGWPPKALGIGKGRGSVLEKRGWVGRGLPSPSEKSEKLSKSGGSRRRGEGPPEGALSL